jgi:muramoyltetrapeptide carboxypeptidase
MRPEAIAADMTFKTLPEKVLDPVRPRRLKVGDTIGIAAPAGPFEREPFERGMAILERMGFSIHIPEAALLRNGFLAGPDAVRAEVINTLFRDPDVHGILCARGGYGSTRVLPYLDWEAIRRHPKVFVGFSDITVLHCLLRERTGLVSFHGPMGTTLATATEASLQHFEQVLMSDAAVDLMPSGVAVLQHGEAAGKVIGGNLSLLCHLVGTPYMPDFGGCILFIEDVTEAPYRIDRLLVQMTLAGAFDGVAGLVLGQFEDCGAAGDIHDAFMRTFAPLAIPVVAGFPFGHGKENTTLPVGLEARLSTRPPRLAYRQAATTEKAACHPSSP